MKKRTKKDLDRLIKKIGLAIRKSRKKVKRIHGNVKCDCGHTQKDHYQGEGYCHHSKHPRAGQCGCTWFHPNVNYIKRKKALSKAT